VRASRGRCGVYGVEREEVNKKEGNLPIPDKSGEKIVAENRGTSGAKTWVSRVNVASV
jgi:hypothetical protein